jgi:hypothetical protein
MLVLPKAALDEIERRYQDWEEDEATPDHDDEYYGGWTLHREAEDHLWCYSEESAHMEQLADYVQAVLEKFDLPDKVGWAWAETCSKPRLDEFGGGAVVVTKDQQYWTTTWDFLRGALNGAE